VVFAKKTKIGESGDYNLSGDRYRVATGFTNAKWPIVEIGDICDVSAGNSAPQDKAMFQDGRYPFFRTSDVGAVHLSDNLKDTRDWLNHEGIRGLKLFKRGTILFPKSGASTFLNHRAIMGFDGYVSSHLATITPKEGVVLSKYVYHLLTTIDAKTLTPDQAYPSLKTSEIAKIKIPLPPIEIQQQIVAELDGYQNIIVGARQIVENWKPTIDIDPKWKKVRLEELVRMGSGGTPSKSRPEFWKGNIPWASSKDIKVDFIEDTEDHISELGVKEGVTRLVDPDTLLCVVRSGILQHTFPVAITKRAMCHNQDIISIRSEGSDLDIYYLFYMFKARSAEILQEGIKPGVTVQSFHSGYFKAYLLPLPPLEMQKQIIKKIEGERASVESAKKLIEIYEQKTKAVLSKLWAE